MAETQPNIDRLDMIRHGQGVGHHAIEHQLTYVREQEHAIEKMVRNGTLLLGGALATIGLLLDRGVTIPPPAMVGFSIGIFTAAIGIGSLVTVASDPRRQRNLHTAPEISGVAGLALDPQTDLGTYWSTLMIVTTRGVQQNEMILSELAQGRLRATFLLFFSLGSHLCAIGYIAGVHIFA